MTRYPQYSFFLFLLLGMVVLPFDSSGKESGAPSEVKIFPEPFTGMEFVRVPGGCFEMGCGSWTKYCDPDESPLHEVCVETVWVGKTEVTQGQWQKITGENPAHFRDGDDYPVEMVSWDDLQGFIGKLGKKTGLKFRLPTEAEWEYACRSGGREEVYCGGNNPSKVAWYSDNSKGRPHPVGTRSPNGLGLYDMSGNVWEWVWDWYDEEYYRNSPRDNPMGALTGSYRLFRGGCYGNFPWDVRNANRNGIEPDYRGYHLGFRLVLLNP